MLLVDVLWFCIDSGTNHAPDSKLELKIIGNFAIFLNPTKILSTVIFQRRKIRLGRRRASRDQLRSQEEREKP